jgi:hypothetical protein
VSILALLALTARANTLLVGPAQPYPTIAGALAASVAGDRIEVDPGDYPEDLSIAHDLEIVGVGGAAVTRIYGGNGTVMIHSTTGALVHLEGLTIDPLGVRALMVDQGATLELVDAIVVNSTPILPPDIYYGIGGSILIDGANATISGTSFSLATPNGRWGGHIGVRNGVLDVTDSTLSGASTLHGGAIYAETSTVTLTRVTLDGNTATGAVDANGPSSLGGGLYALSSAVTLTDCSVLGNDAGIGGGVAVFGGSLVATGGTIDGNAAEHAGGIYCGLATGCSLTGIAVTGNTATGSTDPTYFQSDSTGGGLLGYLSPVVISDGVFTGNAGDMFGGAVNVTAGTATITGTTFEANSAGYGAGVMCNASTDCALTDDAFVANVAAYAGGGAVIWNSIGDVVACDFFDDEAGMTGGAISLYYQTNVQIHENVFCGNATTLDLGGAVAVADGSADSWNNDYVDSSAATYGGALAISGTGTLTSTNDLVAWSGTTLAGGFAAFSLDPVNGPLTSDYDLWFDNSTGDHATGVALTDLPGLDPMLPGYVPGDCAGSDFWPAWGSPVIDAGTPAILDAAGGPSDIGRYGGPTGDPAALADADGDGVPAHWDCDDTLAGVNPDAREVCDAADLDEDCDGQAEDADATATGQTWFYTDGDGDGAVVGGAQRCDPEPGEIPGDPATAVIDCDDADADVHPGAVEVPDNGRDDDCADGDAVSPPDTDPPDTDPPDTDLPDTDLPGTDPPSTNDRELDDAGGGAGAASGCGCATASPVGSAAAWLVLVGIGIGRARRVTRSARPAPLPPPRS